jgi:beta-galactosidase
VKTTGSAAKLALEADHSSISVDGRDLSFVTLTVKDKDGLMVPNAMNHVRFCINGPGEIVATGNGDATSHLSFQSKELDAFNGLCLVIVRAKKGAEGKFTVEAQADGLTGATAVIRSSRR